MARDWFVFVGPYAEWIRPASDYLTGSGGEDEAEWERLIDGGLLVWNIGADSGFPFEHEGQRFRRYCCMPECQRPGCPRWPMLFHFNHTPPRYGETATDWAVLDRQGELDWFRRAFAEELGSCGRLMRANPVFRWGLVYWVRP